MSVRANIILALIGAACMPAHALACTPVFLPPPLPNESPAELRARAHKRHTDAQAVDAAEQVANAKRVEDTWWTQARAIVVFRVIEPYSADKQAEEAFRKAALAKHARAYKKRGKIPPPLLIIPPAQIDITAKRDILLMPVESIRSTAKPQRVKLWTRMLNTPCGYMYEGWLGNSLPGDFVIDFFSDGKKLNEKTLLGIRARDEALDPRIKAIFAGREKP